MTQDVVYKSLEEMTHAFEELTENFSEIIEEIDTETLIYDALIEFFNAENWNFQSIPEQSTLRLAFEGKNGTWDCYAKVREAQKQFVFYSICSVNAPEDKRQAIAEFIARANYGTIIGNFELDFTDGEIRFKTSIDVEGDTLSSALIKPLVYTNVIMMDEYLPGFLAVVSGELSPVEAIAKIESE